MRETMRMRPHVAFPRHSEFLSSHPVQRRTGCGCLLTGLKGMLFVNSNVILAIALIVLKCYGKLDWPWIWVLFPIWLWPTIGILFMVVFFTLWFWANCTQRY